MLELIRSYKGTSAFKLLNAATHPGRTEMQTLQSTNFFNLIPCGAKRLSAQYCNFNGTKTEIFLFCGENWPDV